MPKITDYTENTSPNDNDVFVEETTNGTRKVTLSRIAEKILSKIPVINNLTSTSTTSPLSAAQGKYLNEKITELNSDLTKYRDVTLTSSAYSHIVIPDTSSVNVINVFSKEASKVVIIRGFTSSGDVIVELYGTDHLDAKPNTSCNLRIVYV